MTLTINGQDQELPGGLTVLELLEHMQLDPDGVAIAVNLEVVPRGEHSTRVLTAGERVELVRAVGGG